jgi:hypothetical protein
MEKHAYGMIDMYHDPHGMIYGFHSVDKVAGANLSEMTISLHTASPSATQEMHRPAI